MCLNAEIVVAEVVRVRVLEHIYLQTLLEAGGLVLGILGNGGVGAAALAGPCLAHPTGVPVLISRLLHLSPHLYRLLCIGLNQ